MNFRNPDSRMAMLRSVMKLRPLIQGVPAAQYHEKVRGLYSGMRIGLVSDSPVSPRAPDPVLILPAFHELPIHARCRAASIDAVVSVLSSHSGLVF